MLGRPDAVISSGGEETSFSDQTLLEIWEANVLFGVSRPDVLEKISMIN